MTVRGQRTGTTWTAPQVLKQPLLREHVARTINTQELKEDVKLAYKKKATPRHLVGVIVIIIMAKKDPRLVWFLFSVPQDISG
jgi:hypothetical protein